MTIDPDWAGPYTPPSGLHATAEIGRSAIAMKLLRLLRRRKLELALFLLGVVLRISMRFNYHRGWSYDWQFHWEVVVWIRNHWQVPPVEATFESFHPPLYYAVAASLLELGVSHADMAWFSILCGILRLALIWVGLELYLPGSRWARCSALALVAVLAASVHIDGMIYPEAMNGLLITAAIVLVPVAFRRSGRSRWWLAAAIGLILGLAIMTKVSGAVIMAAIGAAALLELAVSRKQWRTRLANLLPWAGALAVCLAICGWYYARNIRDYGKPFVTSFDLPTQSWLVAEAHKRPYLERRSLEFFVGWDPIIFRNPYMPTGLGPKPQFFPVAIASTFIDYWRYKFAGYDPEASQRGWWSSRPFWEVIRVSQLAMLGGTAIFVATVAAWLVSIRRLLKFHDWGRVALLIVPLFTLLAALHFAVDCPVDNYGVTKGVYMQFGAPPMYALFGVAVGWAQRKSARWPLLGVLLMALWMVAAYTLYCRLRVPIVPIDW